MRAIRFTLTALACALLAGCGTDDIVTPEMEARFTDTDCIDCAPPPPPSSNPYYYGSDTDVSWTFSDAVHKGWSWTGINDGTRYASGRVDAVSYRFPQCDPSRRTEYQRASNTVYGYGKAEVSFRYYTKWTEGFQVKGTHRVTPRPGYTGGGTFYSEASHCDDDLKF